MPAGSGCSAIFIKTCVPRVISSWLWCVIHVVLLVSRAPSWREQVGRNSFDFLGCFQSQYRISRLLVTIYLAGKTITEQGCWFQLTSASCRFPLAWCPEDPPDFQTGVAEARLPHVPLGCLVCFTLTVSTSPCQQWNTKMCWAWIQSEIVLCLWAK